MGDAAKELPQEVHILATSRRSQGRQWGVRIVEVGQRQPHDARSRTLAQQLLDSQEAAVGRSLENSLQGRIIAIGQEQESFDQFRAAMLGISREAAFQMHERVGTLELRIAANAVVARRREFVVQSFREFEHRRGGRLGAEIVLVLGNCNERRNQIIITSGDRRFASAGESQRLAASHGLANGSGDPIASFRD